MSFDPYQFDRSYHSWEDPFELYLSNTFLWLFLGLMLTFGVALACWLTGIAPLVCSSIGAVVLLVIQLCVVIFFGSMLKNMEVGTAKVCFLAYSVLDGFLFSVYFYLFELGSLIFTFLAAAVFFGVFALYGYLTRNDLSSLRPVLISGLAVLIIYGVIALFVPGLGVFDGVMVLGGVALFLTYTANDMQNVQRYYYDHRSNPEMLEKAAIFSAFQLQLDFINLFIHLIDLIGKRRD